MRINLNKPAVSFEGRRRVLVGLTGLAFAPALVHCRSEPSGSPSEQADEAEEPAPPGSEAKDQPATTKSERTATAEENAGSKADPARTETVELIVGDGLKYDKTRIQIRAGSTVELTIRHTGKLPKSAMGHNFVLLEPGTDLAAFATAAMGAKDNGHIPPSKQDSIIAHTELVGGGESDTIEFEAPPEGEYDYICSFPGHYQQMQGKLVVS